MYAARPDIQNRIGRIINDQYFTQTLLPDYMKSYPKETANWNVVFDARGHFQEPHTNLEVPLGTLGVRRYLKTIQNKNVAKWKGVEIVPNKFYPTKNPIHRYKAILFIEKEGFMPLFEKVELAKRFDIAIMSTKGMSVTASRLLVDELGGEFMIPLLVIHDFDKAGFSILGTLRRNTRRYRFKNKIRVVNFGLRLKDVEEYDLETEEVFHRSNPEENLLDNGATYDEADFLKKQRVELNAFTSGDLVKWIENRLDGLGVKKVVPAVDTLNDCFRWAIEQDFIKNRIADLSDQAAEYSASVKDPNNFQDQIVRKLISDRSLSWDEAVVSIARKNVIDNRDKHNR